MDWQKEALVALRNAIEEIETDGDWKAVILDAYHKNRWFEEAQVLQSIHQWRVSLSDENINNWLLQYDLPMKPHLRHLGVIMAGNIPLVGMHDIVVGVIAGYHVLAKPSSVDTVLPCFWIQKAAKYCDTWKKQVSIVEQLKNLDVAIATGSNNSARYFSRYFQHIPHIIRNNRNSVAVLSGKESDADFLALGSDVFDYFGLGCRNVTHFLVPQGYDFTPLFQFWDRHFYAVINHNKYANNYEYHRAILLMNLDLHIDTGYLIAKENTLLYAPVGMLNYSFYTDISDAQSIIYKWGDQVQCVVGSFAELGSIPFGTSQQTKLHDYADGVDTLSWLLQINH